MRIIHLIRCTTWGGGERYALDLCKKFAEEGHDVCIVTRGIPEMDSRFSHLPVRMEKMPLGGFLDFTSPHRLARLIESFPEEEIVVHVHNFKDAELAARAKGVVGKGKRMKLVCTRHLVKKGKGGLRWKWLYNSIDAMIFVSQLALDEFLSGNPPIEERKLSVVPNSIILPQEYTSPSPLPGKTPLRVLFTGRIFPEKGIEPLLRSIPLLNDLPLMFRLVGTGEEGFVASMKALVKKLGIEGKVEWAGFVADVYKEIEEADICVAPSLWREPFGLTLLEFMSQARPVVTTDNGAQHEILTDGKEGLLIPPGNPEALASAIRTLAENPEKRKQMGEAGKATFLRQFSYDLFYQRILKIYGSAAPLPKN